MDPALAFLQSQIGLEGAVGLVVGPILIIWTVEYVELVKYYVPVKNHIDRISIATLLNQFCIKKMDGEKINGW